MSNNWGGAEPIRQVVQRVSSFLNRNNQPARNKPNATVRALNRASDQEWRDEVRRSFERPAAAKRTTGRTSPRRGVKKRLQTRSASRKATRQ